MAINKNEIGDQDEGAAEMLAETATASVVDHTVELGRNIRAIRKQRGWTLVNAAERFAIGLSTLTKIESGQMSPTIGLLQKIANGFQMDVVALLSTARTALVTGRLAVTRAGHADVHETEFHIHELLATTLKRKRMQPFRSRIKANDNRKIKAWFRHNAEEFVFILEGKVVLHSEFYSPTELNVGDSVYLDARMGHYFVASGHHDAIVLFIIAE